MIMMPKRKNRLSKKRARKKRTKSWDFVSPLGAGVGASAKLSAIGKVPALLPAMGAGFG